MRPEVVELHYLELRKDRKKIVDKFMSLTANVPSRLAGLAMMAMSIEFHWKEQKGLIRDGQLQY